MTLKKFHNILYFNIFQFHCFFQYWVSKPILALMALVAHRDGYISRYRDKYENWDDALIRELLNNPKGGISLFLAARFMGVLEAAVVFTFWNLVSALLELDFYTWKYGGYLIMLVGLVAIVVSSPSEYLSDFRKFKSWSTDENRKFAIITLLVVSAICLAFVGSFALYLPIAINNKQP